MKKVLIIAGVALVLFWVLSRPEGAAGSVNSVVHALGNGANQLITFVRTLFGG